MTKGRRNGFVTKAVLAERLEESTGIAFDPEQSSARALLGYAIFHGAVTPMEQEETVERVESTIPCYLHTHVTDGPRRDAIEKYVVASSRLYRRGSIIANLASMAIAGPRLADASDPDTPRPMYNEAMLSPFDRLVDLLMVDDPRKSKMKQVFLPERWPTEGVQRADFVVDTMNRYGAIIPSVPDWKAVMMPTGWDNAINRMATKFIGNLKVHARANLVETVAAYVKAVALDAGDAMSQVIAKRLRPLAIHDDDWAMLYELRKTLGVKDDDVTWYPPSATAYTRRVLQLHLFLARYGVKERSYLPVVARGRAYSFMDTKVARSLFAEATRAANKKIPKKKRPAAASRASKASKTTDATILRDGAEATISVGEYLGITSQSFDAKRRELRQMLKRRYRVKRKKATKGDRRRALRKLEMKWHNIGCGRMPKGARIDSVETDGYGIRLCIKTPIEMSQYIKHVPTPQEMAEAIAPTSTKKKRKRSTAVVANPLRDKGGHEPKDPRDKSLPKPLWIAIDTGRAKLFVAAVSRDATSKPTPEVFTRRRYYHEMHYEANRKWELSRRSDPSVAQALVALTAGGTKNCSPDRWTAYLEASRDHDEVLEREYVKLIDRARWRMRMFRWKKSSLDRAVDRLVKNAIAGEHMSRPLVFTVGAAGFAPTGPGEIPAPTAALSVAFKRGIKRVRTTGRVVVVFTPCEFRTTMCCCACGAVTTPPRVMHRGQERASRRLRSCTSCNTTGKLRDRDIQASRNILWIAVNMYYGIERPAYLTRGGIGRVAGGFVA